MAFTVSSLTNYVNENEAQLVSASIFGGKTQALIQAKGNVQAGIKSAETINVLASTVGFQTDSCGWNASGTTTFSQRTITVGKIKIMEALCPRDLEAKYTQKALAKGSKYDTIPFEQQYSELKAQNIANAIESAIWKGDTGAGNANYSKFDGLIKIIDAASGVTEANSTGGGYTAITSWSNTNVVGAIRKIYNSLPVAILDKEDVGIFVGVDVFRMYNDNLTTNNWYHYNADGSMANMEIKIPGTNVTVYGVNGLNTNTAEGITANNNRAYAMRLSNIYLGVDMLNEEESFEIFNAKEADEIRFISRFKMGVQVAFPSEIVKFTI